MPTQIDPFGLPPEEAIAWFRAKGFATSFDWRDVWQQQHSQAFTVAKAMQADILEDLRQAVDDAISNGTTLQQFRKDLKPTLQAKGWWGRKEMTDPVTGEIKEVQLGSPRRLKTIYDTNLRQAHSAGQWQSIQRTKATRPYLRYVHRFGKSPHPGARPKHQQWHDLVRPKDDPIWDHIMPMNGWGCHCKVQSMSERDLARYGLKVSEPLTLEKVAWRNPRTGQTMMVTRGIDPGFDYNPGKQTFVPGGPTDPSASTKPPREEKPRADLIEKHTPEYWEKHYREQYGDAAPHVAWGRAAHERSKEMPDDEAAAELRDLLSSDVPGVSRSQILDVERVAETLRAKRKVVPAMQTRVDGFKLLAQHVRLVGAARPVPKFDSPSAISGQMAKNEQWWSRCSSNKLGLPASTKWKVFPDGGRANYKPRLDEVWLDSGDSAGTAVHEYGHAVEERGGLSTVAGKFISARTRGEALVQLRELVPSAGYEPSEWARPDKFYDPYLGKVYSDGGTELVSSVTGHIAQGRISQILEDDPESLYFVLGVLAGVR